MKYIIVTNDDEQILSQISNYKLVIKLKDISRLDNIENYVKKNNNSIYAIVIEIELLETLNLSFLKTTTLPLILNIKKISNTYDILDNIDILRKKNIKIFLSSDYKENILNLQILSSLGCYCGFRFNNLDINWEALTDLMYYALIGRVKHGTIEPFQYIASSYKNTELTDFDTVYFNNIYKFIHINSQQELFLNDKMTEEYKINLNLNSLDAIGNEFNFKKIKNNWHTFFYELNDCCTCAGWRICIGKFANYSHKERCKTLFSEMIDIIEQFKN